MSRYKVSCTDADGNVRVIRTADKDAAEATAAYWRAVRWASDVQVVDVLTAPGLQNGPYAYIDQDR